MPKLHIDIETYCELDIKKVGMYKYIEHPSFEVLMIAVAIDDNHIEVSTLKSEFDTVKYLLLSPQFELHAHNATFERLALNKWFGIDIPAERWSCSMVKAAYCGLPLQLDTLSKALKLGEKGKLSTGKALIKYFCEPCKPTKTNGGRLRNLPEHDEQKWQDFKTYCAFDVEAERAVTSILEPYELPELEKKYYNLDQKINDRGVLIDTDFVNAAIQIDATEKQILFARIKELTDLENPNSDAQIKKWLFEQTGETITSLSKEAIPVLIDKFNYRPVNEVLNLRKETGKTSIRKYYKMIDSQGLDGRGRGYFQFYGANRTGRWAGRFVQLQNLPRNYLKDIEVCRELILQGDHSFANLFFEDLSDTLSQLIRTAFIARGHCTFAVADFSSIEARVTAWLAGEQWRLDIFKGHGKIYEASASMMFGVPIEEIGKGTPLRQKGKIAELALGFGGSVGALIQMGGEDMGLSESEMRDIVTRWREKSPNIVNFWSRVDKAAKRTLETKKVVKVGNLTFLYDGLYLTIELPSGRKLFYYKPTFTKNRFGGQSIRYQGLDQDTKQWAYVETYGGKLTENIVQAIARDLLAHSMLNLDARGYKIALHVHDEVACEIPEFMPNGQLRVICDIMGAAPDWAQGLPLNADGYLTKFYKKD